MSEHNNNCSQVAVYTAVERNAETDKPFDPETGEILEEERKGPIDLRA